VLKGDLPDPANPPSGCRFHTRCPVALAECAHQDPPLLQIAAEHRVACLRHRPGEESVDDATIPQETVR
jgi:oligopeptide/dipeptide ABC transporter ATP-binding protein